MTTATGAYATWTNVKRRMGITDTTDDTLGGLICDQVNGLIESPWGCGRVVAPISSAAILLDGDGSRILRYPKGIRAISLLEVAFYTGGSYTTVPSTDYFLRPGPADLSPGFSATRIELSDRGSVTSVFPDGYNTVRSTMTTGVAAIPDELTAIAEVAAAKAWHAVQAGQQDIVGTDDMGRPLVSRFFSKIDLDTLQAYSVNLPG